MRGVNSISNKTKNVSFRIDTNNTPNGETIAAMLEAERIAHDKTLNRYSDVEEALRELKS